MGTLAQAKAPAALRDAPGDLHDLRFSALLGTTGWARLPAAVRARFAHRCAPGGSVCYTGQVLDCRMSLAGRLLGQACRLIGAPLPLDRGGGLAAVVTVTEHAPSGGQTWTRIYVRPGGFPQVIHSAKRFAGPTGLEEYLGLGFGIALRLEAGEDRISFLSDHYFLRLGPVRMRLPRWLAPGALRIDHLDDGAGQFRFVLNLRHRLLGELIHQEACFADQPEPGELP